MALDGVHPRTVTSVPAPPPVAFILIALLTLVLAPAPALAHQNSVTYLRLTVSGRYVMAVARIDALDLNEALGITPSVDVTPGVARAQAPHAATYVSTHLSIRDSGMACVPDRDPAVLHPVVRDAPRGGFTLTVSIRYVCPHTIEDLDLTYSLFFDVDPRHQGLATLDAFGGTTQRVFKSNARELAVRHPRALSAQLSDYVSLGIGHIFLGYDHMAFLIALLLVAAERGLRGGVRQVLAIVTAFTVAHSLTLIASAVGWIAVSPRLVEPAIALSILVVAAENLLRRPPRHRWALAFAFGLVHGFGFAGVLSELGLPARAVVPSLLAFNLGVEAGQLTVVVCAFPVLVLLARGHWRGWELFLVALDVLFAWAVLVSRGLPRDVVSVVLFGLVPALFVSVRALGYPRGGRVGASIVLAALAALWFVERANGWVVLHGRLG